MTQTSDSNNEVSAFPSVIHIHRVIPWFLRFCVDFPFLSLFLVWHWLYLYIIYCIPTLSGYVWDTKALLPYLTFYKVVKLLTFYIPAREGTLSSQRNKWKKMRRMTKRWPPLVSTIFNWKRIDGELVIPRHVPWSRYGLLLWYVPPLIILNEKGKKFKIAVNTSPRLIINQTL